jgi:NitT/TauT family transport system ATP-binding protein
VTSVRPDMSEAGARRTDSANEISFDRIGKAFDIPGRRTVQAVQDVSGTVPAGEFVSIVGPSGCGKSTLLAIVAGLDRPTTGTVAVGGAPVTGPRRDVGFVFQEDSTLPWRTALRNVTFGMEMAGVPKAERQRRAAEMLAMVGLSEFGGERPARLSGGMRQRLAIARTLALQPSVLLMDEPFGALDQQTRLILGAQLLRIWSALRPTVLFVTHSIEEAVLLSTEVWVMSYRPGEIIDRVPIDLPYPRDFDIVGTDRFNEYTNRLWGTIRRESLRGFSDTEQHPTGSADRPSTAEVEI